MANDDLMQMVNPDLPDCAPATTTEAAFRTMWEPRGWERADPANVAAAGVLGEDVVDLDGLTKAQLLEVAANLDVNVAKRDPKETIAEAIRASIAEADTDEEA